MFALGVFWLLLLALVALLVFSSYAFYKASAPSPGLLQLADPQAVAQAMPQRTKRVMSVVVGMLIAVTVVLIATTASFALKSSQPEWDPDIILQTLTLEGEVASSKGAGTTNLRLAGNFANDVILRSLGRSHIFRSKTYEPFERVAVSVRKLKRTALTGDDDVHLQRLKIIAVTEDDKGDTQAFVKEYTDVKFDPEHSLAKFAEDFKDSLSG